MSLKTGLLLVAIVLAASLATTAMVSNPAFADTSFKNKAECMEYVIDGTKVVRNHVIQNAKVSRDLAEKLCAEY
jgi:myo-inositol-1-phosphate synthase